MEVSLCLSYEVTMFLVIYIYNRSLKNLLLILFISSLICVSLFKIGIYLECYGLGWVFGGDFICALVCGVPIRPLSRSLEGIYSVWCPLCAAWSGLWAQNRPKKVK